MVTGCSCVDNDPENYASKDKTGAPKQFRINQDNGHVMFAFQDNSLCENAFSFSRVDEYTNKEFRGDLHDHGVAFSSDFYYSGREECGADVLPMLEASDDLRLSKLIVGEEYAYCVRAINNDHYMDTTDVDSTGRMVTFKSSASVCDTHTIGWEASIHGKVTTEPNAGSLAIKKVSIEYELLTTQYESILGCGNSCKGTVSTNDAGEFNFEFNIANPYFKGKNEHAFPVRLKFQKTTKVGEKNIEHIFLCNHGQDFCDTDKGYIVYLTHMQFKEPLHIYDILLSHFAAKSSLTARCMMDLRDALSQMPPFVYFITPFKDLQRN